VDEHSGDSIREGRSALEIGFKRCDPEPDGLDSFWHAVSVLTFLAERGNDQIFDVMLDALLRLTIPPADVEYHATDGDGLWRTKWRNIKVGQMAQLAVSEAWQERENTEALETANAKTLWNTIARAHSKLEEMVRADPELKDFTVGKPLMHCSLGGHWAALSICSAPTKTTHPELTPRCMLKGCARYLTASPVRHAVLRPTN
jgi:hypothetical protein